MPLNITVDCNNDVITVKSDSSDANFSQKIKQPVVLIELLDEIFNRIDFNSGQPDIKLVKIDEDSRTTVGEW